MKSISLIPAVLCLLASSAFAQADSRVELIHRIEAAYTRTTMFSPESPFVKNMLGPAIRVNPGVSNDIWDGVAKEVAPALSQVMTEEGGAMDTFVRASIEPLSDAELQRLATLMNDPAYLKFQAMMTSSSAQQRLIQAVVGDTAQMAAAINAILARHGLKEVR